MKQHQANICYICDEKYPLMDPAFDPHISSHLKDLRAASSSQCPACFLNLPNNQLLETHVRWPILALFLRIILQFGFSEFLSLSGQFTKWTIPFLAPTHSVMRLIDLWCSLLLCLKSALRCLRGDVHCKFTFGQGIQVWVFDSLDQ